MLPSIDPIVYVVQDPDGKDIASARAFGRFHVILTGKETTSQAVQKLRHVLQHFKQDDYLLPIGKSIHMGVAIHYAWEALLIDAALRDKSPKCLNLLIWRREQYEYTIEKINI